MVEDEDGRPVGPEVLLADDVQSNPRKREGDLGAGADREVRRHAAAAVEDAERRANGDRTS